jgi:hypothetical protein
MFPVMIQDYNFGKVEVDRIDYKEFYITFSTEDQEEVGSEYFFSFSQYGIIECFSHLSKKPSKQHYEILPLFS